jgi:hypothetical protein
MLRACSTNGEKRNAYRLLVGKPEGKGPLGYPLDRRVGGPQSRSGRHGEDKILGRTGTRTPTTRSSSRNQSLFQLLRGTDTFLGVVENKTDEATRHLQL